MSSKEIEEKVLEMRFDNRDFEKNAAKSMSTLDKLKGKLEFKKSAASLDAVGKAANKVSFRGMENAINGISKGFSVMEVAGITAIANVTNSVVNQAKHIARTFTLEPITTGFQEYELKMGSVQTIMMSTGESLEKVNGYLNQLNEYSDKTIYSFQDMTQNIGKFTNAGVELDDAVKAIQGISNEAAVSGANANEASRAMYNFAQALSAGYVKLIDWKSIENANMATVEFKQNLLDTALQLKVVTKTADGLYHYGKKAFNATKEFNDSLQTGWMTNQVLIQTLGDYANAETAIGEKAFRAAQEVKTFSMMMDTLKEAAQSGWATSWELIIGDYNQSKSLWTQAAQFFGDIIDNAADARNELFRGALYNTVQIADWEKLEEAGLATKRFRKAIKETAKEYGVDVKSMIKVDGDFKSTLKHNWLTNDILSATIQRMGNEISQSSDTNAKKLKEYKKLVDSLTGGSWSDAKKCNLALTAAGKEYQKALASINATLKDNKATISDLTVEQFTSIGYTEKQAKKFIELSSVLEMADTPLNQLMNDLNAKPTGRDLLIDSARRSLESITRVIGAVKDGFHDIFPRTTSNQLYNIIVGLDKLTRFLEINSTDADNLRRTFRGLFSVIKLVADVVTFPLKIGFQLLSKLIGQVDGGIFELTGNLGDDLYAFSEWARQIIFGGEALEKVVVIGQDFIKWLEKAYNYLNSIPEFNKIFGELQSLPGNAKSIGSNIIAGLLNGIQSGFRVIPGAIVELCKAIISAATTVLNIHSPSRVFFAIGGFIVAGLIAGIASGREDVLKYVGGLATDLIAKFQDFDLSKAFQYMISGTTITGIASFAMAIFNLSRAANNATKPLAAFGEIGESVADVISLSGKKVAKVIGGVAKVLKGISFRFKMKAVKDLAIAIAILAGAFTLLTYMKGENVALAIGALTGIAMMLTIMTFVLSKIDNIAVKFDLQNGLKLTSVFGMLIGLGGAALLFAVAIAKIGRLQPNEYEQGLNGLAVILASTVAISVVVAKVNKTGTAFAKLGGAMLGISASLLVTYVAIKKLSTLSKAQVNKASVALAAVGIFYGNLLLLSRFGKGDVKAAGSFLIGVSGAMLTLSTVLKKIGSMEWAEIGKGTVGISAFCAFIGILIAETNLAGEKVPKLAGFLLSVSVAMTLMVGVVKMMSRLSVKEIAKGLTAIGVFTLVIKALLDSVKTLDGKSSKLAATLVAFSVSIGLLGGIAIMLSLIDVKQFAKGAVAIGILASMIAGLMLVSKDIQGSTKSMIALSACIGVMAVSLAALAGIAHLDTKSVMIATGAISLMVVSLGAAMNLAKDFSLSIKSLIALTTVVALLSGVCIALTVIDAKGALKPAIALSSLITAISAASYLLSESQGLTVKDVGKLVVMGAAMVAIGGFLAVIDLMPIDVGITKLAKVSLVMVALTGIGFLVNKLPALSPTSIANLATMELFFVATAAVLDIVANEFPANIPTKKLAQILGVMTILGVLGAAIAALGTILGAGAGVSVAGSAIILGVIAVLGLMFLGLAKIFEVVSGMEIDTSKIDQVIAASSRWADLCKQLALVGVLGIPALAGTVVLAAVVGSLTGLTATLGAFTDVVGGSKQAIIDGVEILGIVGSGIGKFFGGIVGGFSEQASKSLPRIGSNLSMFMITMQPFLAGIKMVGPETAGAINDLATGLLNLQKLSALEGISKIFTGAVFAHKDSGVVRSLQTLAMGAAEFNRILSEGKVSSGVLAQRAEAVRVLCEALAAVPNDGGIIDVIFGWNGGEELRVFAENLGNLGDGVAAFYKALKDGNVENSVVENGAKAAKYICEAASEIPNSGGWLGKLVGENPIRPFARNLAYFGEAISEFAHKVDSGISLEAVKVACDAGNMICDMAASIPNSGGFLADLMGDNDLKTFSKNITKFGEAIIGFCSKVNGIKIDGVSEACGAAALIGQMASNLPRSGGAFEFFTGSNDLGKFSKNLKKFGTGIKDFYTEASTINASYMQSIVRGISELVNAAKTLKGLNPNQFKQDLATLAEGGIKGFVEKFDKDNSAVRAVETFNDKVIAAINQKRESFKNAGEFLATGFIEGIQGKIANGEVAKIGSDLGSEVDEALRERLGIHSPATQGIEAGEYYADGTGIGVVNGTPKVLDKVKDLASGMTNTLTGNLKGGKGIISTVVDTVKDAAKGLGGDAMTGFFDTSKITDQVNQAASAVDTTTTSTTKKTEKKWKNTYKAIKTALIDVTAVTKKEFEKSMASGSKAAAKTKTALGAVTKYANTWAKHSNNQKKATKEATKAIDKYIQKLYKESDYYKNDRSNLKSLNKELNNYYKQKNKLYKELSKATSPDSAKSLKKQIDEVNKSIAKTKKNIKKTREEIKKDTLKALKEYRNAIKDTVKEFTDVFKVAYDTGIDIFSKWTNSNELNRTAEIENATGTLASAKESLAEATNELAEAEAELAKWQEKSILVDGRSQKYLDNIAEAEKRVLEAKKKVTEATLAQTEAQTALDAANKDTSTTDLIDAMKSQNDAYDQWQANIGKLTTMGFSKELAEYAKSLGFSGAETIITMMKMSAEEVQKANQEYSRKLDNERETYTSNLKDKQAEVQEYGKNLDSFNKKLKDLNVGAKTRQKLLEELEGMSYDEGNEYMDMILGMDDKRIKEWAKDFKKNGTLAKQLSDTIVAVNAEVNAEVEAETKKTQEKQVKKQTEKAKKTGEKVTKAVAEGTKKGSKDVTTASKEVGETVVKTVKSKASAKEGKKIGKNFIDGLISGLDDSTLRTKLSESANSLGALVPKTVRKKAKIKSPSRVMEEIGKYLVLGLSNGLDDNQGSVVTSAQGLGDLTVAILKSAMEQINDASDELLDTTPVISPVLNLDDFRAGVDSMSGMFGDKRINVGATAQFAKQTVSKVDHVNGIHNGYDVIENNNDTSNVTNNNTFVIRSTDPKGAAKEVSKVLGKEKIRRDAVWDS